MTALAELRGIVGEGHVREAGSVDAIDGVQPKHVVAPGSIEEVSALMGLSTRNRWLVAPRGGGTAIHLGNPPEGLDLILDVTRLDRVIEHAAGDLVATVEAGARLDAIQSELGRAGQMLALDGYGNGATIGGVVAANTSGPRRLRYGTVRDLLIGITIVLPDGTIAKAGGKVVKNVAGYDLAKLMTGSLGTLGVIVKTIFRLHPRPRSRRLVVAEVTTPEAVASTVQRALHSALVPTALHLSWPGSGPGRIALLLEGIEPSVIAQAAAAEAMFGADSSPRVLEEDTVEPAWTDLTTTPDGVDGLAVKVTCLPTELGAVIGRLRKAASTHGGEWHLSGAVGNGILMVHLSSTDPSRAGALVQALRSSTRPGHVTVVSAPPEVKKTVEVWGPLGDTEPLMRRVKDRFDPDHILNPGRFVGGI